MTHEDQATARPAHRASKAREFDSDGANRRPRDSARLNSAKARKRDQRSQRVCFLHA